AFTTGFSCASLKGELNSPKVPITGVLFERDRSRFFLSSFDCQLGSRLYVTAQSGGRRSFVSRLWLREAHGAPVYCPVECLPCRSSLRCSFACRAVGIVCDWGRAASPGA